MSACDAAQYWEPAPRRIAVFRALQLGDLLCAVPALRALKRRAPDADITLVGLPWAAAFAARFSHYLDRFVEFPGACGLPERIPDHRAFPHFIADMRGGRYDLAVQLHGSGALCNLIVEDFGARACIAHEPATAASVAGRRPWRDDEPEILRWLALLEAAGAPACGSALEFPLTTADHAEFETLSAALGFDAARCVCVHPGARLRSRRWGAPRFAAVGDALAAIGMTVLLTGAPDEAALTAEVAVRMQRPALDLAGRTSLGALAALVARCRLVVANDTGISHVAAALRTPSVIISSGGDAMRWAPLDRARHRVLHAAMPCRPCAHEACPYPDHPCAREVAVAQVVDTARALLAAEHSHAA